MKNIKVFIASSEELTYEREKFDTLFGHINNVFKARGIQLEAVRWEFLDSSMGIEHKQEEYNREIRDCDICVVMFWQRFGSYTNTELRVADAELRAGRKPSKIYVFFKEPGDEAEDLKMFKSTFESQYGHFYCKFDCVDKLQLDFVLQLERFLNSNLITVENSEVKLDNLPVAHLDNIGFAAGNEKYRTLRERLTKLDEEITGLEEVCAAMPNKTIEGMLNDKKRERVLLCEELSEHEQILLKSAVNISRFVGERISGRMKRAVALFEQGKVSEANAVLDEAERDADDILRGLKEIKGVGKEAVDELMLRASTMLADDKYSIEERVERIESIYAKADELACECNIEDEKYKELLYRYAHFLSAYARYNKALDICTSLISLCEKLYGVEHPDTAMSYFYLSHIYTKLSKYDYSLEYLQRAVEIQENVLGVEHPQTALSYNNMGYIYDDIGRYDKALEFFHRALEIQETALGIEHPITATTYNNLGNVYYNLCEFNKGLEFCSKALEIREKVLGIEHYHTASSFNNVGYILYKLCKYDKASEYFHKALKIQEKVLGLKHSETAISYSNISLLYNSLHKYEEALKYIFKALEIQEQVLGLYHPETAMSCNNIGVIYSCLGEYNKALEYHRRALDIREKVLGLKHPNTAISCNNIGFIYEKLREYTKALEYFHRALEIREEILGLEHIDTVAVYNNIGVVFCNIGEYNKALEYYSRTLEIFEKVLGKEHVDTEVVRKNIEMVESKMKK